MTEIPVYGVLVQPIEVIKEDFVHQPHRQIKTFLTSSHVKLLESAGARVVPVDYTLTETKLGELLGQLNGMYIPGESEMLLQNEKFQKTVTLILKWA